MGPPLGDRTRGVLRRHWVAVAGSLVALPVVFGMLLGVREKVAGFQLEATVAPAVDPAAISLEAVLDDDFHDLTRPPTLAEISRFFTEPGTRNMVGAYQTTDLDVSVDETSELVRLVIGDDLRQRTELSLQLYLDGYLEQRLLEARQRAFPVAAHHEQILLDLEETASRASSAGDPALAAELEIEAARLRVTIDEIRAFPEETNGGIETSVLDVGRTVWRTSVGRGVLAVAGGVLLTAVGVVVATASDRRIRTRSDLRFIDPELELMGALGAEPFQGAGDDHALREILLARLSGDHSVAIVTIGCEDVDLEAVERLIGDEHDLRRVPADPRLDAAELAAVLDADVSVAVLGWGRARVDDVTLAVGRIRGAGHRLVGAVVVGVPRRELAPAFR